MTAPRRLVIERLAPTGEGVARDGGKVVFVDGALPGETVGAGIFRDRARYARAFAHEVLEASPERRPADPHAAACGGTDWAHIAPDAARGWKRALFLETMERIGKVPSAMFGDLPIAASPLEYRVRCRFHASGGAIGFFARRSHAIVPLDGCEIVSPQTRHAAAVLASAGPEGTLETLESLATGAGHRLVWNGRGKGFPTSPSSLDLAVGGREFRVSVGAFFQVNRHRILPFFEAVRDLAAAAAPATALDAYSGGGLLTQALVEAGARVTAVEEAAASAADAAVNRERFGNVDRVDLRRERVEDALSGGAPLFDVVVADPPRGGLGPAAAPLAAAARRRLIYVSCEPASLARDLAPLLAGGLSVAEARLEDFFPLTHRVEAIVVLDRR